MSSTTVTFRVDDAEHRDLVARAEREKISLSDYVRVRLGLRGQGSQDDAEIASDEQDETVRAQLADHERRLLALENGVSRAAGR